MRLYTRIYFISNISNNIIRTINCVWVRATLNHIFNKQIICVRTLIYIYYLKVKKIYKWKYIFLILSTRIEFSFKALLKYELGKS